jgi:hypothetical protein
MKMVRFSRIFTDFSGKITTEAHRKRFGKPNSRCYTRRVLEVVRNSGPAISSLEGRDNLWDKREFGWLLEHPHATRSREVVRSGKGHPKTRVFVNAAPHRRSPLRAFGELILRYFDRDYNCEIEMLCLDFRVKLMPTSSPRCGLASFRLPFFARARGNSAAQRARNQIRSCQKGNKLVLTRRVSDTPHGSCRNVYKAERLRVHTTYTHRPANGPHLLSAETSAHHRSSSRQTRSVSLDTGSRS